MIFTKKALIALGKIFFLCVKTVNFIDFRKNFFFQIYFQSSCDASSEESEEFPFEIYSMNTPTTQTSLHNSLKRRHKSRNVTTCSTNNGAILSSVSDLVCYFTESFFLTKLN